MKGKKLTDNEIVKALECCVNKTDIFVSYHIPDTREYAKITIKDILGVINRLQAENDNLKDILYDADGVNLVNYWHQQCKIAEKGCKNFGEENKNLKAENERLKNAYKQCAFERDAYIEIENTAIAEAKAEAYKEFAEKVKKRTGMDYLIDELFKELVGEQVE